MTLIDLIKSQKENEEKYNFCDIFLKVMMLYVQVIK